MTYEIINNVTVEKINVNLNVGPATKPSIGDELTIGEKDYKVVRRALIIGESGSVDKIILFVETIW